MSDYSNKFAAKSYTRGKVYNKIWRDERPLINTALNAKGFSKQTYPIGTIPPYHSVKRLIHLLDLAERKTPKKGYARKSRKALERASVLPSARLRSGALLRKPVKPRKKRTLKAITAADMDAYDSNIRKMNQSQLMGPSFRANKKGRKAPLSSRRKR